MKKIIITIFLLSLICFPSILQVSAYRIDSYQWLDWIPGQTDTYSYRIYNVNSLRVFVPGKDDNGIFNDADWIRLTQGKERPSSIRIHLFLTPWSWLTPCPYAWNSGLSGDTSIQSWWTAMLGSTTVMKENDWWNHLTYNQSLSFSSWEMRCNFWALY